jgi:hypothetical protein
VKAGLIGEEAEVVPDDDGDEENEGEEFEEGDEDEDEDEDGRAPEKADALR